MTKIPTNIANRLYKRFGSIVDCLTTDISKSTHQIITQMQVSRIIQTPKYNESYTEEAIEYNAYYICDFIESKIFDRKPDQKLGNLDVVINTHIPDNCIYMSPKTYYDLLELHTNMKK